MIRKHTSLVIGGVVTLILAALLAWGLISARSDYSGETESLDSAQLKLDRLFKRSVFPAPENVNRLEQQNDIYTKYLLARFDELKKGQPALPKVDRSRFSLLFEDVLKRLNQGAKEKNVKLPTRFSFGFDHYFAGNLPAAEDVDRLVLQLRAISDVCGVLYEAGVAEIVSVNRQVFEEIPQADPGASGGFGWRGGGVSTTVTTLPKENYVDGDNLFSKERFVFTYHCNDAAQKKILTRLSAGTPFAVIVNSEVVNSAKPAIVMPKMIEVPIEKPASQQQQLANDGLPAWLSAGVAQRPEVTLKKEILPRELRVVAGNELAQVRLEVDVYRFLEVSTPTDEDANP